MHFLPDLTLVLCNWRVIVEPSPALGKSCSVAHNVTCPPSIPDREVVLKPTLVAMEYTKQINNHKLLLLLLLLFIVVVAAFIVIIVNSQTVSIASGIVVWYCLWG